ncbi:cytochrome P450 [Micromonospora sp. RP3T]|uniref:cytochrome P450 n=1 Tax=Micromonospora sp. RP3T TaxID=2135446 RepID=UPI000D175565|nr:cytochrome P450 [Micromonospora sp. RP3T]PTA47926.1 cytochrome P450 [Micromonospora sp. RP3T]
MTKPLEFPIARRCPFDPPEEYARLRAEEPIARARLPRVDQEVWLVTRHDHVRALLTDPRLSSDRFDPQFPQHRQLQEQLRKGFAGASKALIGLDLPEHTAPRRMVVNEFTMRRVNELRPRIQEIVDERIDAILAGGNEADLWTELATQVPAMTISELLGVPDDRREFFQRQTEVLLEAGSSMEAQFAASGALNAFMEDLITGKEADPGDDLLGRLIVRNRETGVFTHAELVGMAMLLLVAGHETVSNMIALGTIALLREPGAYAELQKDPDLVVKTVEEMLRYQPTTDGLPRFAKEDIEIGGVTIKAGDGVMFSLTSANRDEEVFDNAAEFDPHRGDRRHVSFGYGIHQCLGQNLARTELEITFRTLVRRIPTLRLAVDVADLPYKETVAINGVCAIDGVSALPVTW